MCPALTRACLPSAATPRRPRNPQEALDCCARIGYPCMLKASWGGGGKGIRKVRAGQQGRAGGLGGGDAWARDAPGRDECGGKEGLAGARVQRKHCTARPSRLTASPHP